MIRSAILRLYKQHHIKKYIDLTEGQYSCWGNFDSMSVEAVTFRENTLIESRDTFGLMDMWYQLSDMLGSQNGTYSQQCIGLIYEGQDNGTLEAFLEPDEYFCCACLLKLKNSYQTCVYDELALYLGMFDDSTGYIRSLSFRSMDNADAVVLIKGNSYKKIMDHVIGISRTIPEILYTYSICGVNQSYLINTKWKGAKHPLMDDKIHQITSRIVAKPAIDTVALEEMFGGSGEWAWVFGNTDIVWNLREKGQTISRAINLMRPYEDEKLAGHAVASHSHPLYGSEIYGITTEVVAGNNAYQAQNKAVVSCSLVQDMLETQWCRRRIEELKKHLPEIRKRKNDMLYSYYLALIQSLTMLVPYEESLFAKDQFYIVFPSLLMFHKQLDIALKERASSSVDNEKNAERWEELIINLASYLDMLDQIIYRSIHSEQTFFMVPGYCGVLYTIFPKLSMMYMAFLYSGIEVLQDESEIYECCLYPRVNSKPSTSEIDFHLQPAERLIEIKVSQRSMFTANLMPILLLHELSHYVGICRNRLFRAYCMIQTWGALLTKMLFWDCGSLNSEFQKDCLTLIYEENREDVQKYITMELEVRVEKENRRREKEGRGEELYFNDIFFMLDSFSGRILEDDDKILRAKIQKKGDRLKTKIRGGFSDKYFTENIQELERLYFILDRRMLHIFKDRDHKERLKKQMKICFKETYADIIALYLIGFQDAPELFERYLEVFYLSEGINFSVHSISIEVINRVAVTVEVVSKLDSFAPKSWSALVRNKKKKYRKNKEHMNSIDYLVLYAHIYRLKMEKRDGDLQKGILQEISKSIPPETEDSIAEISITWHSQMEYFNQVIEGLREKEAEGNSKEKDASRKNAKKRIRELYALLNDPIQSNYRGLRAFDDMIRWYTSMVDKKKEV